MIPAPGSTSSDHVAFLAARFERRNLWEEYLGSFNPDSVEERAELDFMAQRAFRDAQGLLKAIHGWGLNTGAAYHDSVIQNSPHPHARHISVTVEMPVGGSLVHVVRREYSAMGRVVFNGGYGSLGHFEKLPQDLRELLGFLPECTVWSPYERFASHAHHGREDARRLAGCIGLQSLTES